eukprot:COSAG03_NODE_14381_length_466_cov_1.043597_1_plen_29_part_10
MLESVRGRWEEVQSAAVNTKQLRQNLRGG